MRNYIVIWDSGLDHTAHGPWPTETAANNFATTAAKELWERLFYPEPPNDGSRLFTDLYIRSGNKFTTVPIIPPGVEANAEDSFSIRM